MKKKITIALLACFASLAMTAQQPQQPQPVPVNDTITVVSSRDVYEVLYFIRDKVKTKMLMDEWDKIEQAVMGLVEKRKAEWLTLEATKQKKSK